MIESVRSITVKYINLSNFSETFQLHALSNLTFQLLFLEPILNCGQLMVTGSSYQHSVKITHMVVYSWLMLASVERTEYEK